MNSFNTIVKHFGERRHGEVCRNLPLKPPPSRMEPIAKYEFILPPPLRLLAIRLRPRRPLRPPLREPGIASWGEDWRRAAI
jgi:hypothetical protein